MSFDLTAVEPFVGGVVEAALDLYLQSSHGPFEVVVVESSNIRWTPSVFDPVVTRTTLP